VIENFKGEIMSIDKKTPFVMRKFIAPKCMTINEKTSPCNCTISGNPTITCSYCVQANLLAMEKKFKNDENTNKNIIASIKTKGIRATARDFNTDPSTVRYWIKSRNIPQWVLQKYGGVGE
jgi:hypothetical protein